MSIKEQITDYWQKANNRYDDIIQTELHSVKKDAWVELIKENIPQGRSLHVLDIGTGPGFFPLLLSEMGHKVTAIDCTENMLDTARQNTEAAGFDVSFHLMDAHKLDFDDNTFDVIINRNVTWLLTEPAAAYEEWHRVLKPQGRLLIFDGNHFLWLHDDEWKEKREQDRKDATEAGYKGANKETRNECHRIAKDLFFSKVRRPQWDIPVLMNMGFGKIFVDTDVTERIGDESSKINNRTTPLFLIRVQKTNENYLYGI